MGEIRELVIHSVGELVQAATPDILDHESGRYRSGSVFRGGGSSWGLLTSLDRLGEEPHTKANLEGHILRNFRRYSRAYLRTDEMNHWEVLVVARHHGLPTRLLDWSYSPLVAAHFATIRDRPGDRVIWEMEWRRVHEHFGIKPLSLLVEDVDRLLVDRGTSLEELLEGEAPEEVHFACLFEPPALDARLVAQSACFMVSSDKSRPIDEFLVQEGLSDALTRYRIPEEAVGRFRDQLDLCGVDERRLFPDLDGLAAFMRRYYS